jgi:hypothetical protein
MKTASRSIAVTVLGVALGLGPQLLAGENVDPNGTDAQYAWGENIGWLNAEPMGDGGPGLEVSDFAVTGWMWSENAGWVSLSCENNGICGQADYGVTNDGQGNLAGYAWSENLGWINFAPTTAGVTIDPVTGEFSGDAWSENAGWIRFSGANHGLETGWSCSPLPPAPTGAFEITVQKTGGTAQLSWPAVVDASAYDAVRGDLVTLQMTGGDFDAATDTCLASKTAATSVDDATLPAKGEGLWYLVRGVNCGGAGTYDSGSGSQVGSRDAGIASSGVACP